MYNTYSTYLEDDLNTRVFSVFGPDTLKYIVQCILVYLKQSWIHSVLVINTYFKYVLYM